MEKQFICTTKIEFADRFEGQVLHIGERETCLELRDAIPAIAVENDEPVLSSHIVVSPLDEFPEAADDRPITQGEKWVMPKNNRSGAEGATS